MLSSWVWRREVWYKYTDVLEEVTASIIILYHDDGGSELLCNISAFLSHYKVSQGRM